MSDPKMNFIFSLTSIELMSSESSAVIEPFANYLAKINNSIKCAVEMCEYVQKSFSHFSQTYMKFIDDLSLFLNDIEGKMNKTEDNIPEKKITEWVIKYITNYTSSRSFFDDLQKELFVPVAQVKVKLNNSYQQLEKSFEESKAELKSNYKTYKKQYEAYLEHCQLIEKTGELMNKDLANSAKYHGDLDKLRDECYEKEKNAIEANEQFGHACRLFQEKVEQMFLNFEESEKVFFSDFQSHIYKFAELISKLSINLNKSIGDAFKEMDQIEAELKSSSSDVLSPRKVSPIVENFSNIPSLTFNVFDFLPWKTVFHGELHSSFMTITNDYTSTNGDYLSLKGGEIVKVLKEQGSTVLVESDITGIRGKIPYGYLKKSSKEYKRKVYLDEQDFDDNNGFKIQKGQYVCSISEDESNIRCKTVTGSIGNIPSSILTLVKKK